MTTSIRCSMLPAYPDCPRRAAAKQWRHQLAEAGYDDIATLRPSVGAAVGRAVHAGIAAVLQGRIDNQRVTEAEGLEIAVAMFLEETETGAIWDDATPSPAVATFQIGRMMRAYLSQIVPALRPALVETAWETRISDDWRLTGCCDVVEHGGTIRDTKTGALLRPYQTQLGGYAVLAENSGLDVRKVVVDFVRRTPRRKPQDPVITMGYDVDTVWDETVTTITHVRRDMAEFQTRLADDRGADPVGAFMANPMSMMCTPDYCPAHGTSFCSLGGGPPNA